MKVQVRLGAATNPYLSRDGLIDQAKLIGLKAKIDKAVADYKPEMKKLRGGYRISGVFARTMKDVRAIDQIGKGTKIEKAKDGSFTITLTTTDAKAAKAAVDALSVFKPVPTHYFVRSAKAKYAKFDAAKNRKGTEFGYLGRRIKPVVERKRLSAAVIELLPVYSKDVIGAALQKHVAVATKAVAAHAKNIDKYKAAIDKARTAIRKEKAGEFDKATKELRPLLEAAGISEANIVMGSSIGGQTMFVKLPKSKSVVQVSISTPAAMKKAAESAGE